MPLKPRIRSLLLVALVVCGPTLGAGCATQPVDKRILQYLNTEGFGKRYIGIAEEENYVTIGDTVQFVDTYNPDVRGSERVDIDGTIQIPEAGAVFVAGLTRTELEAYLTQKLSPYYIQTDVKVEIQAGANRVYYVMGQVGREGPVRFTGDKTLFEAVLEARPAEYRANLGRVRLIRADPRDPLIITVDIADMWEHGDSTGNVKLREYDIIYIPPTMLQQAADFVSGLLVPVTSIIRQFFQALLTIEDPELFLLRGGRGRNFGFF